MELTDLGYDGWFQQRRSELQKPELHVSRITRVDRDRYLVRNESAEVQAEPTGKLLFSIESSQDLPCVGDWALVHYYNAGSLAIIHDLLPRKSFLRRKAAGKTADHQIIASNIDYAFIMQSCDRDFNLPRMQRYLVMANDGHVIPIILLSKVDLSGAQDVERRVALIRQAHIDVPVIPFSNSTAEGPRAIQQMLQKGKTYCLLGSSGVGKTTLLNHLLGRDEFDTTPVREKDSRGRHTTSRRQLTVLETGALLIDTPGMRELGMMDVAESIAGSFADIQELSERCRFKDCTHTKEAGCAILQAIEENTLDEGRYREYMKLVKESAFHDMSYVERRQKDKQFGKMVSAAVKELKRRKPSAQ